MFHNPQTEFLLDKKIRMCAAFSSFQSYHSCLLNWPKAVNEDIDCHIDWNPFKKKKKKIPSHLHNPVKVHYPSFVTLF